MEKQCVRRRRKRLGDDSAILRGEIAVNEMRAVGTVACGEYRDVVDVHEPVVDGLG
jgi:hypothetical protein